MWNEEVKTVHMVWKNQTFRDKRAHVFQMFIYLVSDIARYEPIDTYRYYKSTDYYNYDIDDKLYLLHQQGFL